MLIQHLCVDPDRVSSAPRIVQTRGLGSVETEMSLHVLAYNLRPGRTSISLGRRLSDADAARNV